MCSLYRDVVNFHSKGSDEWSYIERALCGIKLIFGARLYYRFCGAVKPSISMNGDYTGMDLLPVTGKIIIKHSQPESHEIDQINPSTHLVVANKGE